MRRVGGDEGCRALLERVLLPLYLECAPALQHEVELVPLVRLLRVGLRRGEDVHAYLQAIGLVDHLVSAWAEPLRDIAEAEAQEGSVRHPLRRVDAAAGAVA